MRQRQQSHSRALIRMSLNDVQGALAVLGSARLDEGLPAMRAERLACLALALAARGDSLEALRCADEATRTSTALWPSGPRCICESNCVYQRSR